jgi:subtilisin family serine protease
MKWFFQPLPAGGGAGRDDDDSAPAGLIGLSAAVLQRHGARVLDPGHAGVVDQPRGADGQTPPPPRPTVYRARTLLIPADLLENTGFVAAVNRILERVGMMVVAPTEDLDLGLDAGIGRGDEEILRALRELPRLAVLAPRPGDPVPVIIDAWIALQALRAAARPGQKARELEDVDEAAIPRISEISLEHLLVGSPIMGDPADGGVGGITGNQNSSSNGSGPTITDSYQFSGGDTRYPVALLLDPPARNSTEYCDDHYGRRPVVAVLDTGVRPHPWLEGEPGHPGGPYSAAADGFVAVDPRIQDAIRREGEHARARGDKPRQVIRVPWDTPDADYAFVGELNPALGHGTFIAGIVRQAAPDARVLAVRAMHSDDVCSEGDIICGLRHLAWRIVHAEAGDLAATVDVLSLSWGYFSESRHDRVVTSGLWKAIKVLLDLGVVVVVAAGNYAMSQEFYPAAFSQEPVGAGQVPVISVGALNPNGTKASFSNDGHWVTAWARGASVISTYPVDVDGSRSPELRIPGNRKPPGELPPGREALDLDDYSAGFAVWSGTSFSAPYLAALVAGSLLEGAGSLPLDVPGKQAAAERAAAALERLRAKEQELREEEQQGKTAHGG